MKLATYIGIKKGPKGLFNRLVRAWLWGKASHTELVFSDGWSFSTSFLDGRRPRFKRIEFNPAHWTFQDIPESFSEESTRLRAAEAVAEREEYYSLMLLAVFVVPPLLRFVPEYAEVCSTSIFKALGIPGHKRYDPVEAELYFSPKITD